jgi:ribonuclease BN (tRNA processing enzyme)
MRVQVLRSGSSPGHPLTGFLVDGTLAIDAGPLGQFAPAEELANITDVLLTHSHIDHVAGLPIFLDTVYGMRPTCPTIHALPDTLKTLQSDLFNDRLMPDFIALGQTLPPFLRTAEVPNGQFRLGRYTILPMTLQHTVPTIGYLVDDGITAAAFITDTAPVPEILGPLARWPRLQAVFLECSFPHRMHELAAISKHHTTEQFLLAARKFPPSVMVYAIHLKPRYWDEILREVNRCGLPNVRIGEPGQVYAFEGNTNR